MGRRSTITRVGGAAAVAGVALVVPARPAGAIKAPFGPPGWRYADNSNHTYTHDQEGTTSLREKWGAYFDTEMDDQYDAKTDLSASGPLSYSSDIDLYWYLAPDSSSVFQVPNSAAETSCMDPVANDECNRFRIAIRNSADTNLSTTLQKNLACHEIGHTVGFRDGGTDGTSCMDGGDNYQIMSYEIGKINGHY